MSKKLIKFSFFITLLLINLLKHKGIAQNVQQNTNSTALMDYPTWLNSSETQYNQFLADSYNYFVTPKGNRLWACAMNLAWNELKRNMLNGNNATFQNLNTLKQKMIDNLNSEVFKKSDLSEDSYYVTAGFGQKTVDKINYEARQKFPSRTFLPLTSNLKDQDFISFAYLFKNFHFRKPFTKLQQFNWKGTIVEGFEASKSKLKKQVYYKYYNNIEDFMIGLQVDSPNDEILLWKTNQTGINDGKFQKVLSMINFYNSLPSTTISRADKFQMPVIDVQYERNYQDLLTSKFSNNGFEEYQITEMQEKIKVKVTRLGVTVENQAVVIASRMSAFGGKFFYLNNDFWLIMKEKNRKPYLVMLVRNVNETLKI